MVGLFADYYLLILPLAALGGYIAAKRWIDRGVTPATAAQAFDYRDPYLIAALRGGPKAVLELAIVALIDRGLLTADEARFDDRTHIKVSREDAIEFVGNDVERALLGAAASRTPVRDILATPDVRGAVQAYADRLVALGLKADTAAAARRPGTLIRCFLPAVLVVILRLLLVDKAGLIDIAFGLGVIVSAAAMAYAKRDARGKAMLGELADLFAGLGTRATELRRGRMSSDAMFCGAAFGLWRLPASEYPAAAYFSEEERKRRSDSGGDSGGGSSCGLSHCGSSDNGGGGGGDSGGGGGCGGGGGGCGGGG